MQLLPIMDMFTMRGWTTSILVAVGIYESRPHYVEGGEYESYAADITVALSFKKIQTLPLEFAHSSNFISLFF